MIFAKTNSSLLQWKSRHNLRATISPDRAKKREFIIDLFALPPENRRAPPPQNYICAISNYIVVIVSLAERARANVWEGVAPRGS